jgi:hypothetical protein
MREVFFEEGLLQDAAMTFGSPPQSGQCSRSHRQWFAESRRDPVDGANRATRVGMRTFSKAASPNLAQ